jgi:CspA family cold shock protein
MAFGSIKRLMRDRGFGFIKVDDGPDIFFHRSHVRDVSFDALEEGVPVEFETAESDKGPRATWVKVSSPGAQETPPGPDQIDEAEQAEQADEDDQGDLGI